MATCKRAKTAHGRRVTMAPLGSADFPAIQALMENTAVPEEFVPAAGPYTLKNFEEFTGPNQGTVLRIRRPISEKLATSLAKLVESALDAKPGVLEEEFGASDRNSLEELQELFGVAKRDIPYAVKARHDALCAQAKSTKKCLKREIRASVTPMVSSRETLATLESRAWDIFGTSLGVLAAPINFLHSNLHMSVSHCKRILGEIPLVVIDGGDKSKPPPPTPKKKRGGDFGGFGNVFGEKNPSGDAGGFGKVYGEKTPTPTNRVLEPHFLPLTPPPFVPAQPGLMQEQDGYLWMPETQQWVMMVAHSDKAPCLPQDMSKPIIYGGWVFVPSRGDWVKVVSP